MKKYWMIFVTTVKEYFVYRLNFVLWRMRTFINLIITFFLWYSALEQTGKFGQYNSVALYSYLLYANLIVTVILGTRTAEIATQINDGSLVNILLKPISFFKAVFVRDLSDKAVNLAFAIVEVSLFIIIFHIPVLPFQHLLLFTITIINGLFIGFFINLMLSFIGFWTTEVWAPRFLFFMAVSFLSGSYFPLDLLPPKIFNLLSLTPFPYLYYFPTVVLIGKISGIFYHQLFFSYLWVLLTYLFARYFWLKGNKSFSFWGR